MDAERLRDAFRPYAEVLRHHALRIDADPSRIRDLLDSGEIPFMQFAGLPREYNEDPMRIRGTAYYLTTCEERVIAAEMVAQGDASMVVGAPGASMSGVLVDVLGDAGQQERFYRALAAKPTWTFFALTEPDHGSDATAIDTAVDAEGGLTGVKRYIGNATRADLGVVFARLKPGPLGLGAVLIDTERSGFRATEIRARGLRGVRLSEVVLDGVPIDDADVLGRHLSPSRRGILGAVEVFNRLRPVVGALGLGVAQAALDLAERERRTLRADERAAMDRCRARIAATRAMLSEAARTADVGKANPSLSAAAKALGVELAAEVSATAARLLGPGSRFEHPYLDKLVRDAQGLEFMEGTGTVQRLNIAADYVQRLPRKRAVSA